MNFILGTAGHIDHGKSSLVQALTGTHPDRLPEEKNRGVTIELGFAHLSLLGPTGQDFEVGVVDVPGHADFVNNMVAGVGALDLALIVVAADDGWMPQSEEHLHILSYLGMTRAIIALTKIDIAEDPEFASEFVRDALAGSVFENSPIIPVSSHTGQGLDELRAAIVASLAEAPLRENLGVPCLPVDRAFSVKGIGTIITGTLSQGSLNTGDHLILQPEGIPAHIRSLQNHSRNLQTAHPGMRAAVNIPDVSLHSRKEKGVKRGQILTLPETGEPSDTIDIAITRLKRSIPNQPKSGKPLKNNQKVRLHYGSGRSNARIRLLDGALSLGQSGLAQLRLDEPLFTFTNDRIVIRDWSGEATLAGARVLDPHGSRRLLGKEEQQQQILKLSKNNHAETLLAFLFHKHRFLPCKPSPQEFPFSNRSFKNALKELSAAHTITKVTGGHVDALWWGDLLSLAQQKIIAYHRSHPDLPGLALQELRQSFAREFKSIDLFSTLLEALKEKDIRVESGEHLKSLNHQTQIPPELQDKADLIVANIRKNALDPPSRKELTPSAEHQRAMDFLIRVKQIILLDEKTIIHPEGVTLATSLIQEYLSTKGSATASELKQMLGVSRRIAIPLLEHLDSLEVTQREGDLRVLAK